jgi:hypothetical protein
MSRVYGLVPVAMFGVAIFASGVGCDAGVQQQKPPRIPDDPGYSSDSLPDAQPASDMTEEEPDTIEPSKPEPKKEVTPEERRQRCCGECVAGLKEDRTGDAPDKIKCQDFTVHVKNACQKWFHDNPMTAAEAQACVAQTGSNGAPDAPPSN